MAIKRTARNAFIPGRIFYNFDCQEIRGYKGGDCGWEGRRRGIGLLGKRGMKYPIPLTQS